MDNTLNRNFLKKHYIKKKKSIRQISKESGKARITIVGYLKKYNIKQRTRSESAKTDIVINKIRKSQLGKSKYVKILTRKVLKQKYMIENSYQIAKDLGCSDVTIRNYLEKFGISRRNKADCIAGYSKILTKQFLQKEYVNHKKTMHQIAQQLDYSDATIYKYLRKFNIPTIRTRINGNRLKIKEHRCIDCGKEISNYKYKRCNSCAQIKRLKDPKNRPCWKDGKSFEEYPQEFTQELKDQIRKRDNYTCQNCDMIEEEHIIVLGEVLSVHHIDYNKKNCNKNNLISLCRQCNARVNFNRKYWKEYFEIKIEYPIIEEEI